MAGRVGEEEPETEVGGRVPPAAARTMARAARTLARAAREAAAATAPAPSPRAGGGSTDGRAAARTLTGSGE